MSLKGASYGEPPHATGSTKPGDVLTRANSLAEGSRELGSLSIEEFVYFETDTRRF